MFELRSRIFALGSTFDRFDIAFIPEATGMLLETAFYAWHGQSLTQIKDPRFAYG